MLCVAGSFVGGLDGQVHGNNHFTNAHGTPITCMHYDNGLLLTCAKNDNVINEYDDSLKKTRQFKISEVGNQLCHSIDRHEVFY